MTNLRFLFFFIALLMLNEHSLKGQSVEILQEHPVSIEFGKSYDKDGFILIRTSIPDSLEWYFDFHDLFDDCSLVFKSNCEQGDTIYEFSLDTAIVSTNIGWSAGIWTHHQLEQKIDKEPFYNLNSVCIELTHSEFGVIKSFSRRVFSECGMSAGEFDMPINHHDLNIVAQHSTQNFSLGLLSFLTEPVTINTDGLFLFMYDKEGQEIDYSYLIRTSESIELNPEIDAEIISLCDDIAQITESLGWTSSSQIFHDMSICINGIERSLSAGYFLDYLDYLECCCE